MGRKLIRSFSSWKEFLKRMLSAKHSGTIIILLVFILKSLQLIYLFDTRSDLSHQAWFAQSLTEGRSIGPATVNSTDLSKINYQTDIRWPPGYSIFMAPLLLIFQQDYIVAALMLNLLAAFWLIIISRKIVTLFDLPAYLVNLFTIVSGLTLFYFQLKPSTDALAVIFFLLAAYYALWILKYNKNVALHMLGITAALLICISLKYLYIPIAFAIPMALWYAANKNRQALLKQLSIITSVFIAIVIAVLLFWQKANAGSFAYVQQTERGFFPANLLAFHAYLPAAFLKPETLWIAFGSSSDAWQALSLIFQVVHWAAMILILYVVLKHSGKNSANKNLFFKATVLLLLATAIITTFLASLSLYIAREHVHDGSTWTYVQEARYYGLLHVLIPVMIFAAYHLYNKHRIKNILLILVLLLLPEMFRGLMFSFKRIINFQKETYGWQHELKFQQYTNGIIQQIQEQNKDFHIVLTGSSDWMTLRAVLYSRKPLLEDISIINHPESIQSAQPAILLVIMRHSDKPRFQPFIEKAKDQLIGNYLQFDYYAIPIAGR